MRSTVGFPRLQAGEDVKQSSKSLSVMPRGPMRSDA